jgi:hypothetical protein
VRGVSRLAYRIENRRISQSRSRSAITFKTSDLNKRQMVRCFHTDRPTQFASTKECDLHTKNDLTVIVMGRDNDGQAKRRLVFLL